MPITLNQDEQQTVDRGKESLRFIRSDLSFQHWSDLGLAIDVGACALVRQEGLNKRQGARWVKHWGPWLAETGFDKIETAVRSRLQTVIDNLPTIKEWRTTLTEDQRQRLNHPDSILRAWKKTLPPVGEARAKPVKPPAAKTQPSPPVVEPAAPSRQTPKAAAELEPIVETRKVFRGNALQSALTLACHPTTSDTERLAALRQIIKLDSALRFIDLINPEYNINQTAEEWRERVNNLRTRVDELERSERKLKAEIEKLKTRKASEKAAKTDVWNWRFDIYEGMHHGSPIYTEHKGSEKTELAAYKAIFKVIDGVHLTGTQDTWSVDPVVR